MPESGSTNSLFEALTWTAVVIVLLIAFWFVWMRLRKWLREEPQSMSGPPWTLQQLREMKDSGQLGEQEYERLRAQLIGSAKDEKSSAEG